MTLKVEKEPGPEKHEEHEDDEEDVHAPIAKMLEDYTNTAANLILSNDKLLAQADELLSDTHYYSINDFEDLDIGEEFTQQLLTMLKIDS